MCLTKGIGVPFFKKKITCLITYIKNEQTLWTKSSLSWIFEGHLACAWPLKGPQQIRGHYGGQNII